MIFQTQVPISLVILVIGIQDLVHIKVQVEIYTENTPPAVR